LVAGVFEGLAVVPSDSVEGFARDDLDVVGGFFSCEGEEFIEEEGSGEDGGAGVVGESFVAEDGGTPAGLFEGFKESDVVAAGLEADGGGETAEARADDEGWGAGGRGQGRVVGEVRRSRRRRRSRRDRGHRTRWRCLRVESWRFFGSYSSVRVGRWRRGRVGS